MRNRKYIVDLNSKTYQVARYKQYDNNINYSIEVIEDGVLVDLDNCIVKAFFETPSKLILQKDCMVSDNTITTILDNNILGEAGKVLVEFTIYKSDIIVTTFTLSLDVEKSINKNDAIQKEPVWDIIANLLEIDETVRIKLEEVDNKIIETTEITNTNTSKIDNKILDIQNQLDSRISEKFTEIDNTLESKTTEKFIAVDEILNEKQTQIQEQVDNKISDADNKILDCEERMQNIESNFGDLVDGTGYATTEFVNKSLEKKSNIDHRHNVSEIDDLNMNAEDISLSDGSNVEENVYRNKENIQYIKNELSKTENTSYTTINGTKEFSCKDGYVDNVVIEGQTKILNAENQECEAGADGAKLVSIGQGDKIEVLTRNEGYNIYNGLAEDGDINSSNGTDEVNTSRKRTCYIEIFGKRLYLSQSIARLVFYDSNKSFISCLTNISECDIPVNARFVRFSTITSNIDVQNIVVGYSSNVNSKFYKQDKKQILTTLRSLPNGVKDTIEKRGNKYYKIKRCEEIVIDNNLKITGTGVANQILTRGQNYVLPNLKRDVNSPLYCNCLKVEHRDNETLDEEHIINLGDGRFRVRALKSKLSSDSLEGSSAYWNSIKPTVVYELATPVIEELPNFNPQTFSDKTTLLLNSGVVQGEASFEVTNSLGSELEVLKGKVSDLDDNVNTFDVCTPILLNGIQTSGDNVYIARQGKLCVMQFTAKYTGGIQNGTILTSIPVGFRPTQSIRTIGGFSNNIQFNVNVRAEGTVVIENTLTGDGYIRINMSWCVG